MQVGTVIVSASIVLLEKFYLFHSLITVAIVFPNRTKPSTDLVKGIYQIDVIVAVDGEPNIYSRRFIVGDDADDPTWVKPILGKKNPQIL